MATPQGKDKGKDKGRTVDDICAEIDTELAEAWEILAKSKEAVKRLNAGNQG